MRQVDTHMNMRYFFLFDLFCLVIYILISVQDPTAMVIDHTSYAVSETEGDHTLIASDDFIKSDVILGDRMIEVK